MQIFVTRWAVAHGIIIVEAEPDIDHGARFTYRGKETRLNEGEFSLSMKGALQLVLPQVRRAVEEAEDHLRHMKALQQAVDHGRFHTRKIKT